MKTKSYLLETSSALLKEQGRLTRQAELLFSIERPILDKIYESMAAPIRIIDLGSGNGAYLNLFAKHFSPSDSRGFELNPNLVNQCAKNFPALDVTCGDLLDEAALGELILDYSPSYVNLRFVLQHLSLEGRRTLLRTLRKTLKSGTRLVIVECNDSHISSTESHPALAYLVDQAIQFQQKRGGDRLIGAKIAEEIADSGFTVKSESRVSLSFRKHGYQSFDDIIFPIWKSVEEDDQEGKAKLERNFESLIDWLDEKRNDQSFDLEFPIFIFEIVV